MNIYRVLQDVLSCTEVIAFIIAIAVLLKFPKDKKLLLVFFILLCTVIVEFLGAYLLRLLSNGESNVSTSFGIYNIYNVIVYVLWLYLYSLLLPSRHKKFGYVAITLYLVTVIFEATFIIDYKVYLQRFAHIVGSLLLAISVLLYFISILREGSFGKLVDNLFFWVSCGVLFYYVVNIPFRVVSNYYAYANHTSYLVFYMRIIFAILMYIMISIGLIKHLRKQ